MSYTNPPLPDGWVSQDPNRVYVPPFGLLPELTAQVQHDVEIHRLSPTADAFARLRVSEPVTMFDSSMIYDLQPGVWESVVSGTGAVAHVAHQSAALLSTTGAGRSMRTSRRWVRYNPGKSHLSMLTGVMGTAEAGVTKRIGLFDDRNGVFFQNSESGLAVVVRTYTSGSVSETVIPQSEWNLDVFDGNGLSGVQIDMTKSNIFLTDAEWLGVGRVRFGFVVDGAIYYCHEVRNANSLDKVYTQTMTLPVRYEVVSTGPAASMHQICSTVISEGGHALTGVSSHSASTGITPRTVTSAAALPVISARPVASFAGQPNRGSYLPSGMDVFVADNQTTPLHWKLVKGGTITGGTWVSAGGDSGMEYNIGGTAVTGGEVVASGYSLSNTAASNLPISVLAASDLYLTVNDAATASVNVALVCQALSGDCTVSAALNWLEVR